MKLNDRLTVSGQVGIGVSASTTRWILNADLIPSPGATYVWIDSELWVDANKWKD